MFGGINFGDLVKISPIRQIKIPAKVSSYTVYSTSRLQLSHLLGSLIPRPRPAFHHTASGGKLGGAWKRGYLLGSFVVLFLFEHSQLPNPAFRYSELFGKVKIIMHYSKVHHKYIIITLNTVNFYYNFGPRDQWLLCYSSAMTCNTERNAARE